uniref:Zinc finger, CCHC-type n=1 Tax=Tanacetum cinerariifolium TaxID=118510 RepID=A0A6L2LSR8_TANCI|nr:zinc finger, CCHC-type [Tanacetum cinerariifolium]
MIQQPKLELKKSKRNRTLKNFRPKFQLYSIKGTKDEIDVKTTFLNYELDEEVYMNQPHSFIMHVNENKVDLTMEFLSSRFSIKDMEEANVIFGIRIKRESNGLEISLSYYIEKVVSQLEYSRVIGFLMYAMTCTRPHIAFAVGKSNRRGGRSKRGPGGGGGRVLSDHKAARGWGQISIWTNTSCTRSEINETISCNTWVQKSTQTNTSRPNATMSSDTRVQKSIRTNTSGTRSETNTGVQKSIQTNTSCTHSETNATMSSDTGAREPVGEDEPNTNVSQRRRGSNIIKQVLQDPSKRTMINLDGGEFTDPKVVRKINSILTTMFNGS